MDQAEDELLGGLINERLLPWFKRDSPCVLLARAVLWQEAWPIFGSERNVDASGSLD
ncbi:hypothetical protein [Mycobacterium sp. JS623]|uniref:hypothetical protein n=1 Tax=Mycobacterium sp. JS623 TaxID=212767 RepID=UPI0002F19EFC|nr:hypothetical protein [Mycobacterium sp. JS623]